MLRLPLERFRPREVVAGPPLRESAARKVDLLEIHKEAFVEPAQGIVHLAADKEEAPMT